jgi:hypothetical protein
LACLLVRHTSATCAGVAEQLKMGHRSKDSRAIAGVEIDPPHRGRRLALVVPPWIRQARLIIITRVVTDDTPGDSTADSTYNSALGSTHHPTNNSAPAGSNQCALFRPIKFVPCRASRQPTHHEYRDKNNDPCTICAAHSILSLASSRHSPSSHVHAVPIASAKLWGVTPTRARRAENQGAIGTDLLSGQGAHSDRVSRLSLRSDRRQRRRTPPDLACPPSRQHYENPENPA